MIKGLLFFVKFAWQHEKRYLVYRILNQFVSSMIPIVAVVMPRYIINELMDSRRISYIALYVGILAGYTFAASALSNWLQWTGFTYRIKLSQDFTVFQHEITVNADYADIESSRFLELKEKAEKFLFGNLHGFSYVLDMAIDIIGKIFTLAGVTAVIASLNQFMVLLFVALVLVSSYMEARVRRKQTSMNLAMTLTERRVMYYGQVLEDFTYGKEIRINNLGDWLKKRENTYWNETAKIYRKSNSLGIRSGVFNSFTSLIQQAVSYAYLTAQVLAGQITIGDFSMYAGGVAAFSGAMRSLMQNVVEVREYRQYYDAIEEYLDIPPKMRNNARLPLPEGEPVIEFRGVSFAYPGQPGYALRNVSMTLKPGEKLSIVGENGAGKTTFVKLLCRIYDPTEGEILLNGVNIRDIDYDRYMSVFSAVFQDYKLYSLSLKDNVALAQSDEAECAPLPGRRGRRPLQGYADVDTKDADTNANVDVDVDARVEAALRKAGFGEKLDALPKGIETQVFRNYEGEGFEPSGGEGQKIALARALFKDAPVVILDEPAAALDPRAEYELYKRFDELVRGKTAVYISHRLSSARFCDNIAVFRDGEVAEYGSHEELMKANGAYRELFGMQAGFYADV